MRVGETVFKWLLAATMVVALFLAAAGLPTLAQDAGLVRLSALEIDLWPEFDRPELLVIFQGRLADDVPLPARLTLTVPKEASEPHAVAWVDQEGALLQATYDVQTVDDEVKVTYTSLQGRAFQLEYYLDALHTEGQQRQFTFRYRLDVSTDDLVLELQRPAGATNVTLAPPAVETSIGFAGLSYHRLPLGAMEAGQTVEWQVRYDKSGLQLSAETLPAEETGPAATSGSTVGSGDAFGAVAIVGVALAVALAGLWLVGSRRQSEAQRFKTRSQGAKPTKPKKRKDRKGAPSPARAEPATPRAASDPVSGFCHRCGTPLKEDALFCHRCGTPRKET